MDLFLLPYLWGTDISFNLTIKTTKAAIPAVLEYEWQLYVEEDKKPSKAGNGIADMTTRENYKAILDLEHFSNAHKYRLDITIKTVSGERCQTVADFETSSRTAFQMFILATLFAIIGGVIGGLIVHFLGG